jgi:hypothetical protein
MKLSPSPTGGLRIDIEEADDWILLLGIIHDAQSTGFDLANHVGGVMQQSCDWQDWKDYVIPDIRKGYEEHLKRVLSVIEAAQLEAAGGAGTVWITREDAFHWYSTLNQARLALEDCHHFGPGDAIDPGRLRPVELAALFRSQFYCAIQSYLLDQGLG